MHIYSLEEVYIIQPLVPTVPPVPPVPAVPPVAYLYLYSVYACMFER